MENNNTHVPDKLDAYMLQVRHALFELICASDESDVISVEAIDDVAVENSTGIVAEQIKNTVTSKNILADRSKDFWKTIYNWCCYIKLDNLNPNKLKLVVVSNGINTPGLIAEKFNQATNLLEAEKALQFAEKQLKSTARGTELASKECIKYIEYCLNPVNRDIVKYVISLFSYDLHQKSYDNTLIRKFNEQLIPLEYADTLFYTMLGWIDNRVHDFTKINKPAFISKKEYNDTLRKESRGISINNILQAVSTIPDLDITQKEISRHDTYIKQLELIEVDENDIFSAACDYLRASAEKTEWAKRGLVNDYSFNDYNEKLKRNWQNEKNRIEILHSKDLAEPQRGQLLYSQCQEFAINNKLQGCDVPNYFGSGSLQALANTPTNNPIIGWHPNYINLLNSI